MKFWLGVTSLLAALFATIAILLLLTRSPVEPRAAREWRALILSEDRDDRIRGDEMASEERAETVEFLLSIVRRPVAEGEEFYFWDTPRNTAIILLGKMRATEAPPVLVDWLVAKPGQLTTTLEDTVPAYWALVEIGLPSVPALIKLIEERGPSWPPGGKTLVRGGFEFMDYDVKSVVGDRCAAALAEIKGKDETIRFLRNRMENERNAKTRLHLERAIHFIESWVLPRGL